MNADVAEKLAEEFGLGSVLVPPTQKAAGWGAHNLLWRLETDEGTWAIKQNGRALSDDVERAFAIERTAHAGGVACPRPKASVSGTCYVTVGTIAYRCHEWIDGVAKNNEDVTFTEAKAMGALVARLHGLQIPVAPQR